MILWGEISFLRPFITRPFETQHIGSAGGDLREPVLEAVSSSSSAAAVVLVVGGEQMERAVGGGGEIEIDSVCLGTAPWTVRRSERGQSHGSERRQMKPRPGRGRAESHFRQWPPAAAFGSLLAPVAQRQVAARAATERDCARVSEAARAVPANSISGAV